MCPYPTRIYDDGNNAPWWAIYTRHQHEKVVADTLLANEFEIFLPLYRSMRQWKDRRKILSLPLFPCYVFIRGGLDRRFKVLSIPSVHMALSRGEQIATIPDDEILSIRRSLDVAKNVEPHPFLKCGERFRVKGGPLQGIEGILTRKKNTYRLILSVDMLAKSVAVEVNFCDVERIASLPLYLSAAHSQASHNTTVAGHLNQGRRTEKVILGLT
jgi:transcription antitermination factor NusG